MYTNRSLPATLLTLGLLCGSLTSTAASADELLTTVKDQQQVAITIYNQDLALIKDSRKLRLPAGEHALAWRDVSAHMQPETALLKNTDATAANGFQVLEQNFDFDLLTPQKLLEKHVGRHLRVIKTHPTSGAESSEDAVLLSAHDGTVLQFADRIEAHPAGRLAFQTLPETLRAQPTLVIKLQTETSSTQQLELAYLSRGLSWQADYVGELSADEQQLDLNGWVTLTNQSGTSYPHARLQLVAGELNRVREQITGNMLRAMPMAAVAKADQVQEESLLDYHLYTFERRTSIADKQTKQLALLSATQLAARKEYRLLGEPQLYRSPMPAGADLDASRKLKIAVFMEFDNKQPALGQPLPKGVMRIYQRDSQGNTQFIGEDRIEHTAKNETVRIRLGQAFDLGAEKKQTDFKRLGNAGERGSTAPATSAAFESAFEITLKNARDEAVDIEVIEPIPGDWQILAENIKHDKISANQARWRVSVPAQGSQRLSYRVRTKL